MPLYLLVVFNASNMNSVSVRSILTVRTGGPNGNQRVCLEVTAGRCLLASHSVCGTAARRTVRSTSARAPFKRRSWKLAHYKRRKRVPSDLWHSHPCTHFHCDSCCHLTERGNLNRLGLTRPESFPLDDRTKHAARLWRRRSVLETREESEKCIERPWGRMNLF